jgi:hypothetical protein
MIVRFGFLTDLDNEAVAAATITALKEAGLLEKLQSLRVFSVPVVPAPAAPPPRFRKRRHRSHATGRKADT